MLLIALFPGYQTKCKGGFQVPLETEVEGRQNIHCSQREISGSLSLTLIHPFTMPSPRRFSMPGWTLEDGDRFSSCLDIS